MSLTSDVIGIIVSVTGVVCVLGAVCLAGAVIATVTPDHRNAFAEYWIGWHDRHSGHR